MFDNCVYSYFVVLMGLFILFKFCFYDEVMVFCVFQFIKCYEDLFIVNCVELQVMDINYVVGCYLVIVS